MTESEGEKETGNWFHKKT